MTTWIRGSVCVLLLALGLCVARAQSAEPSQDDWLLRFNQERSRFGLPSLRPSPVLNQVAERQAEEMAGDGRRLRSRPAAVVSAWIREVGYSAHDWREGYLLAPSTRETLPRELLDGHFRDLGVGAAAVDGGTLYVFLLGWHEGDFFAAATAGLGDRTRIETEMLARINDLRRRAGLPPLAPNPLLDRISQEHAEDMLLRSYYNHVSPEKTSPIERVRKTGYAPRIVAENIARGPSTVGEVMDNWMLSREHRGNVLHPAFRDLGVGIAVGRNSVGLTVLWVQDFGAP